MILGQLKIGEPQTICLGLLFTRTCQLMIPSTQSFLASSFTYPKDVQYNDDRRYMKYLI